VVAMRLSPRRWLALGSAPLTVGGILLVIALFAVSVPLLDLIELKAYDLRVRSRGKLEPSPSVVMAVIDEKSLDAEGRWPWPRSKLATLVDVLARDGAKVIGFDIGFSEADQNSELALVHELERTVDALGIRDRRLAEFITARERAADNDLALARAIRGSPAPVVLGYFFHKSQADLEYQLEPGEIARRLRLVAGSKYPLIAYRPGVDPTASIPLTPAYAVEPSLERLSEAAASSGHFNVDPDPDGTLRRIPLVIRAGDALFPPLSILCAWHYLGRPSLTVAVGAHGVDGVQMGERFIPTDERGRLLVNYLGPEKTFPHVSVTDILAGRYEKGTFKDRIVLVGATAIGAHDLRSTPFSPVYPGVEVHATVIDNVVTGRFLAKPDWSTAYDLLAIIGLGAAIGIALPRMRALTGFLFSAGLFALYILIARWLFVRAGVWLDIVYPLLALAITYVALTVYYYVGEERQRKQIKETFRQYVPPLVVEALLKQPGRLKLGGEEKVLTVLFSDLEGFTTYSERYKPSEMIDMLSTYFGKMSEQVFANWGTLKEYVGDELMAIFGAPLEQADHAARACRTALAMRDARHALGAEWVKIGRPMLRARTGVNSGLMLVGNLGSRYRFAYGVLGDQVNLASRLEGLNRTYGTEILIGENTAQLVEGGFLLREVDMVRVKGRKQAVRVYELLAQSGTALPPEREKALSAYAGGLEAYRQRYWDEAQNLFQQALLLWPEDGPSRTMADRIRTHQTSPPPDDWDGAFDQLVKG
jgi:adenylate cyclase